MRRVEKTGRGLEWVLALRVTSSCERGDCRTPSGMTVSSAMVSSVRGEDWTDCALAVRGSPTGSGEQPIGGEKGATGAGG